MSDDDDIYDASAVDLPATPIGGTSQSASAGRGGGSAAGDSSAGDPSAGDSSASDPVAAQLEALFAVALGGEPPSRVTAESVLRAARRAGPFAEWWATAGWKWGGALVGAAALVGAVLVIGPMMGGTNQTDSASVAGGTPESALSYSGAEDRASAAASQDMAAEMASGDAAADRNAGGGSAADENAGDAAVAGGTAAGAESDSVPFAAADQAAEPSAAGAYKAQGAEQPEAPSQGVALPPLSAAEWTAATGALPADVPVERWGQGQDTRGSALRSDMIGLGDAGGYLVIVAGPDTGPGRDYPGDTDPAITDTVGSTAERLRHTGLITVQVADGTNRVAVAASEPALQIVSRADLTRIARAVLVAAH